MATKIKTIETTSEATLSFKSASSPIPIPEQASDRGSSQDILLGFSPNTFRPILERRRSDPREAILNGGGVASSSSSGSASSLLSADPNIDGQYTEMDENTRATINNFKAALTSPEIIQVLKNALCGVEEFKQTHFNPLQNRVTALESKIEDLEKEKTEMKSRLNELERKQEEAKTNTNYPTSQAVPQTTNKNNNLILYGFQEEQKGMAAGSGTSLQKNESEENTTQRVSVLLRDIGINVSQFQATRMGKENKDKRRPILVEFANIWDRRNVHAARTKLKSRGYKGIYINEDLTKEQAEIFYYARQAKKQNLIHNTWTTGGLTFVSRLKQDGTVINVPVHSVAKLRELIPNLKTQPKKATEQPTERQAKSTTTTNNTPPSQPKPQRPERTRRQRKRETKRHNRPTSASPEPQSSTSQDENTTLWTLTPDLLGPGRFTAKNTRDASAAP